MTNHHKSYVARLGLVLATHGLKSEATETWSDWDKKTILLWMRRLICIFVVSIEHKTGFSHEWLKCYVVNEPVHTKTNQNELAPSLIRISAWGRLGSLAITKTLCRLGDATADIWVFAGSMGSSLVLLCSDPILLLFTSTVKLLNFWTPKTLL